MTIDFQQQTIYSYINTEDKNGTATPDSDGAGIELFGNTWKQISFPYEVTPDTVLEFDFSSPAEGDIHTIGLDNDLSKSQ